MPPIILVRDRVVALFSMQVSLTRSAKLASSGRYLYLKGGEPTRPKLEETSITFIKIETGSAKSIVMAPFFVSAPNSPPLRKRAVSLSLLLYTQSIIRESNPGNEKKGGIILDKSGDRPRPRRGRASAREEGGICIIAIASAVISDAYAEMERCTHLGASACYTTEGSFADRKLTMRYSRNLGQIGLHCRGGGVFVHCLLRRSRGGLFSSPPKSERER